MNHSARLFLEKVSSMELLVGHAISVGYSAAARGSPSLQRAIAATAIFPIMLAWETGSKSHSTLFFGGPECQPFDN
jgi:hypothetical protein